jgi:hypothetical protein
MSVQELIKQAAKTAINTFKTDAGLFLKPSETSEQRHYFDAILLPVEYNETDSSGVQTLTTGMNFEIDHETFERLYHACDKDFSRSIIVQYRDNIRKTWKIMEENPYEELVIGGVMYRLNTIYFEMKGT